MKKYLKLSLLLVIVMSLFMASPVSAATLASENFCVKSSSMWQLVGYALYAVKIVIPLIIIALGIMEFAKAIVASDEKAISKAATSLGKRLILGVAVFLVPTIVSLVMSMISTVVDTDVNIDACQKCLLDPTGDDCTSYKAQAKNK